MNEFSEYLDPGLTPPAPTPAPRDSEEVEQVASRSSFRVTRNAKGQIQFELKIVSVSNSPEDVQAAFNDTVTLTERMIAKYPFGAPSR